MKTMLARLLLMVLAALVSSPSYTQDDQSDVLGNPELANARALLLAGRTEIVREDMHLSEEEAAGFWPIYDAYIESLATVRERKATLIASFVRTYRDGLLTEEYAEWLLSENFAIRRDWLAVQESFVPKFREVLPATKVARFIQLENKMDAEVDARLALVIPLVEPGE